MNRLVLVLGTVALAGCKAESLGVEVPKGGAEAISMEDLRRDSFILEANKKGRSAGEPRPAAGWQGLSDRLAQMKTLPAFGRSFRATGDPAVVCSEKRGAVGDVVLVTAEDDPTDPGRSTAAMAMLISLAKAWDTRSPPPRTILFCAWDGPEGFAAFSSQPPVPLNKVQAAVSVGGPSRSAGGVEWTVAPLAFSGAVGGLDFKAVHQRTLEVERDLRAAVTADP
jgi:hypothetical protein